MSGASQGRRTRLTYANVVTTLAVLGAIAGGTAFGLPGKNSVQANDLRKNAVKAAAIAKNAVRSAEIKDGAVGSADVADGGLAYGDLGQNSVVARMRSTPVTTTTATAASPLTVPLTGNVWTQAGNEMDVFFGQFTISQTAPCGGAGSLTVELLIDGVVISDDWNQNFDLNMAGSETRNFLTARPWLFEPGEAKERTASLRVYDNCTNDATSFTIESVKVNAMAMR